MAPADWKNRPDIKRHIDTFNEWVDYKSKFGVEIGPFDKPIVEKCPLCGSPFLVEKTTKRDGTFHACPNKECGYRKTE